jgi:LPXTG-motif cell wall-anchored protein
MRRLLVLVAACVATAALAATPALAGGTSTGLKEVRANVYFEEGDCNSRPTIDVESEVGKVVYTLNGDELQITKFSVPYGTSGVVIATALPGYVIVGPTEFPFDFTFDQTTCGGTTTGGTTTGTTTGGTTTGTTTGGTTTGTGGVSGGGGTGGTTGGTTGGVAGAQTGGELPFTGLPVWVPLLAGAALLSGGALLLRRKRDELS